MLCNCRSSVSLEVEKIIRYCSFHAGINLAENRSWAEYLEACMKIEKLVKLGMETASFN